MSKNWGRTPVSNADKRHLTQMTYVVPTKDADGNDLSFEERIDRRPMGKVERFVDKDGNIVSLQVYADGDTKRLETEQRLRAAYHRKGFVEYAKCPIKHGTRSASEIARKDFAKMPEDLAGECKYDPRVMDRVGADARAGVKGDLCARESCQHIEWLIGHRKAEAQAAYAKRNAHVAALAKKEAEALEFQKAQVELVKEQLAERKARKSSKAKDAAE